MSTGNWARLYQQGRCKEIGVPWKEEELHALYELNIPVEYVRSGILTVEDLDKAVKKDEKDGLPLERHDINQVRSKASDLGIDFTNETPHAVLVKLIKQVKKEPKGKKDEGKEGKKSDAKKVDAKTNVDPKSNKQP